MEVTLETIYSSSSARDDTMREWGHIQSQCVSWNSEVVINILHYKHLVWRPIEEHLEILICYKMLLEYNIAWWDEHIKCVATNEAIFEKCQRFEE